MLPATPRGSGGRARDPRRSATTLLLILSLTLSACISVTPAPPSPGPSESPPASALPSVAPSLAPSPTGSPVPGSTTAPTVGPSPSAPPVEPLPSASVTTAAGGPASVPPGAVPSPVASQEPSTAPASDGPSASPTPRPQVTAPALTPGPPRQRALAETEVYGFLPYWELSRADTIDLSQLTTLAWFGVEAGPRGNLIKEGNNGAGIPGWIGWMSDDWKQLQARAQEAGVRVVLTVQRFSWTEGQRRRTIRLLSDPAARMRLTAEVMTEITAAGADGVNLDFEPMPAEVTDDFTQLVREMRAAMNAVDPTLQLTYDVMPGIEGYDIEALTADDAADALFVMGYEYLTGSAARTGSNAPLDKPEGQDLAGDVERILGLVPPGRVILGLPWYGRAWSTTTDQPRSPTRSGERFPFSVTILYRDAIAQAARTGRFYDTVEESAWTLYPSKVEDCTACRVTWRQLWYDDIDSTTAKVQLALDQELRGVGFWALGYQGAGPEMWSVLRLTVGGERDRRAPTGTAELDPGSVVRQRQDLPVVGRRVGLDLTASDGAGGSGPAFVRVSMTGAVDDDGQLTDGTTFPVTDSIAFDVVTGGPVYDLPLPRAQGRPRATPTPSATETPPATPSASPGTSAAPEASSVATSPGPSVAASASPGPSASPTPTPTPEPTATPPAAGDAGRRVIRVQWRDVAGNWSEPISIPVWYRPGAEPQVTPTPAASPTPSSEPPFVPGESPSVEESEEPLDPVEATDPSPSAAPSASAAG